MVHIGKIQSNPVFACFLSTWESKKRCIKQKLNILLGHLQRELILNISLDSYVPTDDKNNV